MLLNNMSTTTSTTTEAPYSTKLYDVEVGIDPGKSSHFTVDYFAAFPTHSWEKVAKIAS